MKKIEKPKYFLVLKILGVITIILGVVCLIVKSTTNIGPRILTIMSIFGVVGGLVFMLLGFQPEIKKLHIKNAKYIQENNKEDLTDIANTGADIVGGAVTKTTKAIKNGLTINEADDNAKTYCKHCGSKIDADSKFCNKCGGEQ